MPRRTRDSRDTRDGPGALTMGMVRRSISAIPQHALPTRGAASSASSARRRPNHGDGRPRVRAVSDNFAAGAQPFDPARHQEQHGRVPRDHRSHAPGHCTHSPSSASASSRPASKLTQRQPPGPDPPALHHGRRHGQRNNTGSRSVGHAGRPAIFLPRQQLFQPQPAGPGRRRRRRLVEVAASDGPGRSIPGVEHFLIFPHINAGSGRPCACRLVKRTKES